MHYGSLESSFEVMILDMMEGRFLKVLNESQWVLLSFGESWWVLMSLNETHQNSLKLIETWDSLRLLETPRESLRLLETPLDPPRLIETYLEPSETFHHVEAHDFKIWLMRTIVLRVRVSQEEWKLKWLVIHY